MENFKTSIEIINKVKWYMERKDYEGLNLYIEEAEKNIMLASSKEEEYIDQLVKSLK